MKHLLWMLLLGFACSPTFAQTPGAKAAAAPANKQRADAITGRIVDAEGQPLPGAPVTVFKVGSNTAAGTVTDAEGKFNVQHLTPGSYRVSSFFSPYVTVSGNAGPAFVGDHVTLTLVKGGVITGSVLTAQNEPLVGAMVAAQRMRNADGEAVPSGGRSARTDDRGIYRIFGLPAGAYFVVVRNNAGLPPNLPTDAPTYFPSATRDTAQEVVVGAGAEVTGIDIQFRGERAYAVSGTVSGLTETNLDARINLSLSLSATGAGVASSFLDPRGADNHFAIYNVPDGEYEIRAARTAMGAGIGQTIAVAAPQKVRVRGGDVTGLDLKLLPTTLLAGRVVLEKFTGDNRTCAINRIGQWEEMLINAAPFDPAPRRLFVGATSAPDASGDFSLRDLPAGRFRLTAQLPSDFWYLKGIHRVASGATVPSARASAAAPRAIDVGQQEISLAAGEKLTGVTVTVAEGAASVEGNVVAVAGASLPTRLLVHLLPVDAASDNWRAAVAAVQSDATFSFRHLAPGKYWLIVRPAAASSVEANSRAALRREAEAANHVIELTPCQRLKSSIPYRER